MRVFLLALAVAGLLGAQERFAGTEAIDSVIEEAVLADQMPGAVVWIGQGGKVLHRKAYGSRSLTPANEPMTMDTIFDAASLTKVVATTSSMMRLVEQGKVRLPVKVKVADDKWAAGVEVHVRLKSAVAVAQEKTHRGINTVGGEQIHLAVPIEVSRCDDGRIIKRVRVNS